MNVSFPFSAACARTEGKKKTATMCLIAAREFPLCGTSGKVNKVRRIGAFPGAQRKSCLGMKHTPPSWSCLPANAKSRKERRSLGRPNFVTGIWRASNGCRGGETRPWQRLADCRCRYTSFSATHLPTTGRTEVQTVGATTDPRHGCSVNTTESGSRLNRFTLVGVALTGGDTMPIQRLERNNSPRPA